MTLIAKQGPKHDPEQGVFDWRWQWVTAPTPSYSGSSTPRFDWHQEPGRNGVPLWTSRPRDRGPKR